MPVQKLWVRWSLLFLSLALGVGVFGFLVWREGSENILVALFSFGSLPFIGFVLISMLNFVLYSWRWQLIVNRHLKKENQIPLGRMYMHRMAGFAVSYLTPAAQVGGEPVRIGMLMSDGVSAKKATSAVLLDIAIELFAYFVFIIAGVALALASGLGEGTSLWMIGLGLIIALGVLGGFFAAIASGKGFFLRVFRALRLHKWKRMKNIERWIRETEDLMTSFMQGRRSLLIVVALLALTVISFRVVEVFYLAWFFGISLSFAQAFLTATLPGVALILPIPAGLGVFEGGFAAVFEVLGIPLTAVAFALIIRLRDAIFITAGSMWMVHRGEKFFGRKKKV